MPFVRLSVADTELTHDKQAALAKGITELLATDLEKDPTVAVVQIALTSAEQWYVHARNQPNTTGAHAEISITKHTNTAEQKDRFIRNVYDLLQNILGALPSAVYVTLYEIDAESWGYNGLSQLVRHQAR